MKTVPLLAAALTTVAAASPTTMPTTIPAQPDAFCKLSPAELNARRAELIPGLFRKAKEVKDIDHGLRFTFDNKPGLVSELCRVIEGEQDCCSFLSFRLVTTANAGPITLEVTGPAGTAAMLRKL